MPTPRWAAVEASGGDDGLFRSATSADLGRFAVVADPGGGRLSECGRAGAHTGFEVIGESGTPNWFELHTSEYEASLAFYRDTFGWVAVHRGGHPEFRYTTHSGPDPQYAGVMDTSQWRPEGSPGGVVRVLRRRRRRRGRSSRSSSSAARSVDPAEDTPYGRLATATDPTGARFKLLGPNVGEPPAS